MSPDMSVDHTTQEPQQPCRLLALSAELRNKIYTMAFEDEVVEDPFIKSWVEPRHFEAPALLMTCRQIYSEARLLFYATATFRATFNDPVTPWMSSMPKVNRCHIRNIQAFVPKHNWLMATRHWAQGSARWAFPVDPLTAANNLKRNYLWSIRDSVRGLVHADAKVEINIWVNSNMEEETDGGKLRNSDDDGGVWVKGEQEQDLMLAWTCDPEGRVKAELQKRAALRVLLEERAEKMEKLFGE